MSSLGYTIGFIGCGNMAQAMIKGALASGVASASDIVVSAKTQATRERVQNCFGVKAYADNADVVRASDVVVLAVRPHMFADVLAEITGAQGADTVLVSLAPGKDLAWLGQHAPCDKIIRLMPNTPAAVGEGMTAICANDACSEDDICCVETFVNSFGRSARVTEKIIDAVIPVSGSAPAYVYMFIEAMADAAVLEGMPRAQAYEFAAQAVLGSAKMVLESGQHPGALKDAVCSPGGTTIEGVRVLERAGMRSAVIEALEATAQKAREM